MVPVSWLLIGQAAAAPSRRRAAARLFERPALAGSIDEALSEQSRDLLDGDPWTAAAPRTTQASRTWARWCHRGSIVGMWAVRPSIVSLRLEVTNLDEPPVLQFLDMPFQQQHHLRHRPQPVLLPRRDVFDGDPGRRQLCRLDLCDRRDGRVGQRGAGVRAAHDDARSARRLAARSATRSTPPSSRRSTTRKTTLATAPPSATPSPPRLRSPTSSPSPPSSRCCCCPARRRRRSGASGCGRGARGTP